ncbi:calcium uniporter protein, mitochondrial, putative [Leishmania guyanensis]|uniref:Mitochondrial calcium uniporter n=2 Tax=Leishmania guyanensis species complex TaxID=38579 RepID=A0AAW3BLS7_9TRYP|nr:hypothetical protein, conserved [Leishmania guyanensis]
MRSLSGTVLWRHCGLLPSVQSAPTLSHVCRRLSTLGCTVVTSRAYHTRPSKSAALSANDFATLTPLLLLRQALQQHTELDGTDVGAQLTPGEQHIIISRTKFCHFCATAHVEDPEAALADLEAAGVVVVLDGGSLIHLRPALYLETLEIIRNAATASNAGNRTPATNSVPSVNGSSFLLEEAERRVAELTKREKAMRYQLEPAIARAARWRRSVWGGALLYAGAQLAVISRLTYFDLDWDIMEPVSYIITITNSLVFFLYYLRFHSDHSYGAFDQRFLPRKVRQYAPKDFDWAAYADVCQQVVEARAILDCLSKWAEKH